MKWNTQTEYRTREGKPAYYLGPENHTKHTPFTHRAKRRQVFKIMLERGSINVIRHRDGRVTEGEDSPKDVVR